VQEAGASTSRSIDAKQKSMLYQFLPHKLAEPRSDQNELATIEPVSWSEQTGNAHRG
jgi:hypothetical protein